MGMPPHIKCCGCCCSLNVGVMIGSGLYIAFLLIFSFVLPFTGTQEDIEHAKAFCAGTTAVYRKGDEFGSYDVCYRSDVCAGTKWDDVESEAQASNTISMILDVLALLLMIATLVLTIKKHAAISKLWMVLAVFPALWLLNPIVQAAVSAPAQTIRFTGITFYEMAATDKVCNDPAALSGLEFKSGFDKNVDCKDKKWIGAPDTTDDLNTGWRGSPCKDTSTMMGTTIPFAWYFVFHFLLWGYLAFHVWSFSVELAKKPTDDKEMAAKPAVAVAVATAA